MEKNRMNLCLARQNFQIVCDDSAEYMKKLEASVNERIEEVQKQYPGMSTTRCTLLAMLNMEDELTKSKARFDQLEQKISQLRSFARPTQSNSQQPSRPETVQYQRQEQTEKRADSRIPTGV